MVTSAEFSLVLNTLGLMSLSVRVPVEEGKIVLPRHRG